MKTSVRAKKPRIQPNWQPKPKKARDEWGTSEQGGAEHAVLILLQATAHCMSNIPMLGATTQHTARSLPLSSITNVNVSHPLAGRVASRTPPASQHGALWIHRALQGVGVCPAA